MSNNLRNDSALMLTVGEWRSLWGRVLSRTAAEFASGRVDALAWSTAAAGSRTTSARSELLDS